jgi:hypothetical protein
MFQTVTDILERVNAELVAAISRFQPEHTRASAILPEEVAALRKEIHCAASCLRRSSPTSEADSDLDKSRDAFRHNLEELKLVLPGLQARLLAEQARLSAARTQCRAASDWVQASHKTL